jgi:hypothetical protein
MRRSTRSTQAPMKAPNKAIGSMRNIVISATSNAEPVC